MGKYIDITGKKFGRLTAVRFFCKDKNGNNPKWLCECDCGKEKPIAKSKILSGWTKSCGCLRRETMRDKQTTHGLAGTRFERIWSNILTRCNNKKNHNYRIYGGRGIQCLWKSLENFRDDMYKSYLKHVEEFGENETSIDRLDNDKGYYKENTRWATNKEQSNNQKYNGKYITYKGKRLNMKQLSKKYSIPYGCFLMRINRYNYSIKNALETPVRGK